MSFPTSPVNGQYVQINNIAYTYDGTKNAWLRIPQRSYTASATAPANPTVGSLWYKTGTDVIYQFLSDGVSYYWLDINTQSILANAAPSVTYLGDTFAGNLTFTGNLNGTVGYLLERANVAAQAPAGITNIDLLEAPVQYFTANATTNITANIRGNATIPLNNLLSSGRSATFVLFIPQGAAAYYVTGVKIDNVTVTPSWQGGTGLLGGNSNSMDIYTFAVLKVGNGVFKVFSSQVRYQHPG
jgi:hypothetical protein